MKAFEYNIIKDAITIKYQKDKNKEVMERRFEDVEKAKILWAEMFTDINEADMKFSERFWTTLRTVTTDNCIKALLLRYESGYTYEAIAKEYNYSRSCAEQNVKRALERILRPTFWEVVLFNKVYVKEYKQIVNENNIIASKLSKRVKTVLIEFFNRLSTENNTIIEPTYENVIKYLTDITMLSRCGKTTIKELIDYFGKEGYKEVANMWLRQAVRAEYTGITEAWIKQLVDKGYTI